MITQERDISNACNITLDRKWLPGFASLLGWSMNGFMACPSCDKGT